ncbi:DUF4173 domain-containing protein [Candidatus Beckwithbacteria bacterium]|nr:DUF4173 domain-containing protein [Candidatus Beckwithbacteria bacterium]
MTLSETILAPFISSFNYTVSALTYYVSLFLKIPKRGKADGFWGQIVAGLVLSLPILLIVISLLSSADPFYGQFMKQLFNLDLSSHFIQRLLFSAILLLILLPLTAYRNISQYPQLMKLGKNIKDGLTVLVPVVLLIVALGLFLTVQWSYIFASVPKETELITFGIKTYSEYVRRGFVELLLVATIIYFVSWLGLIVSRNIPKAKYLKLAQTILLGEILLFIISIYRRVWLYQSLHGWSLGRLYGCMFLFWLTGMVITLGFRYLTKLRLFPAEALLTILVLASFSLFPAEDFIANNHPPTVNNRIDYTYLSRFSPDGVNGWLMSYKQVDQTLSNTSLLNKAFYEADERLAIINAGMVLDNLTSHYLFLAQKYGSTQEKKQIVLSILAFQKQLYLNKIQQLEQDESTNSAILEKLHMQSKQLATFETQVTQKNSVEIRDYIASMTNCISAYYEPVDGYITSPFSISQSVSPQKPNALDSIFTWNLAEYKAYQILKAQLPFKTLLASQSNYLYVYNKILKQAEKDREVAQDLSFDTIFLTSVYY